MEIIRRFVDEMGRIRIPDEIREELGIKPLSEVDVCVKDGAIILTPVKDED